MSLTFLILLLVVYKNDCCVHLRLLTAVEYNFSGEHYLSLMDYNGTVALIFWKQGSYNGMNFNIAFTKRDINLWRTYECKQIHFICLGYKEIYFIFESWCMFSVLFSTKCHTFNNSISFFPIIWRVFRNGLDRGRCFGK